MTKGEPSVSRIEKRLLREMGHAVHEHDLICDGDRILVAVSGGKDSLGLLSLLLKLGESWPTRYSLVAVNIDQGQPGFDAAILRQHFEKMGVPYRMVHQDTWSVTQRLTPPGKTYCSVCSRLRRGILYRVAGELGCNKIALGHHREDLIETLLLSACFAGALRSMPPRLLSDNGQFTVIRPLVYCPEPWLISYAQEMAFSIIPCGLCALQDNHQRKRIKELIAALAAEHPAVPGNLLNALRNVVPTHLLDRSLMDRIPSDTPDGEACGEGAPVRIGGP